METWSHSRGNSSDHRGHLYTIQVMRTGRIIKCKTKHMSHDNIDSAILIGTDKDGSWRMCLCRQNQQRWISCPSCEFKTTEWRLHGTKPRCMRKGKIGTVHPLAGRMLGPMVNMSRAPPLPPSSQARPALVVTENETTLVEQISPALSIEVQRAQGMI